MTRNETIASLFKAGQTVIQLASEYGVSHQRISQILHKLGVDQKSGGRAERKRMNIAAARSKSDAWCERWYGVPRSVANAIKKEHGYKVLRDYKFQRKNARRRKIKWELTLSTWLGFWLASGVFERRGRGRGKYVMARRGDVGPYSISNIFAHEAIENLHDGRNKYLQSKRESSRV